jgi:WD40 repeat protein
VLSRNGRVEIVSLDGSSSRVLIEPPDGPGFEPYDRSVLFSTDGTRALVLTVDGRAFVADTRSGEPIWFNATATATATGPAGNYVENGDISPDGSRVFLELDFGTELRSVDVPSGDIVAQVFAADLGHEDEAFWGAKLSPDGHFLDTVLGSGVARFDAATLELIDHVDVGAPPRTEQNPESFGISDVAHVPGSNDVLAVGRLGRIYRLDVTNGEVVNIGTAGDDDTLWQASVSSDGSVVAATSASGLSLFDAATLEPIGDPLPAVPGPSETWFTPDGALVTNSRFGVSEWELDPDEWQTTACQAAGRNLTRTEWDEYLGDEPYRATCPQWPPASD